MIQLNEKSKSPYFAVHCLFDGLFLLFNKTLRPFLWGPILINIVLYAIAITLGFYYLSGWIDALMPSWLRWLEWILWPLLMVSFMAVGFFTFTIVANLIAAPFYSKLAYKTIHVISGQTMAIQEPPWTQVLWSELKRVGYLFARMLPVLILFVIPGVNVIAPMIWMLFGAWSLSLEYMAYPLENQGLLFVEQKQLLKKARVANLSFGGVAVLALSVPVFNLLVSPAAVIGATLYIHRTQEK